MDLFSECNDHFVDSLGDDCNTYATKHWCTPDGGYGSAWDKAVWGPFADYANSNGEIATVCTQCGCVVEEIEDEGNRNQAYRKYRL